MADAVPTLATLRERGAERIDPVRFRFIEALARRAEAQHGEARRLLDDRLAKAIAEYAVRDSAAPATTEAADGTPPSPLADLVNRLAQHAPATPAEPTASLRLPTAPAGELKALHYFRDDWARLSVDQQLAQALAQGPENAGPLNPHRLVLRALERMRDLSPDYLHRFMSYADALVWLEAADGISLSADKAPATDSERKRKNEKPAKR